MRKIRRKASKIASYSAMLFVEPYPRHMLHQACGVSDVPKKTAPAPAIRGRPISPLTAAGPISTVKNLSGQQRRWRIRMSFLFPCCRPPRVLNMGVQKPFQVIAISKTTATSNYTTGPPHCMIYLQNTLDLAWFQIALQKV